MAFRAQYSPFVGIDARRIAGTAALAAESPYNGQELSYCEGATHPDPYHATSDSGVACAMTEGASGGPWLSGFDASSGSGTITSVSSFKYGDGSPALYGPPFGPEAAALYRQAEHA